MTTPTDSDIHAAAQTALNDSLTAGGVKRTKTRDQETEFAGPAELAKVQGKIAARQQRANLGGMFLLAEPGSDS